MILTLDPISAFRLLAITIGRTKLQLVVGTREASILAEQRFAVENDHAAED